MCRKKSPVPAAVDASTEEYRRLFGVNDKYLIIASYDTHLDVDGKETADGYIVYIDKDNDIDYIDTRDIDSSQIKRHVARLQHAEAVPSKHLPERFQIEFKRCLGVGYVHALESNFDDLDSIIASAGRYLESRNHEYSRRLLLGTGLAVAAAAAGTGLGLYLSGCRNPWVFGILFGILGSFVSVWQRSSQTVTSSAGGLVLHMLECLSRIMIGTIFGMVAMTAVRCHVILPQMTSANELYAYILISFAAGFSERFIPSIIEKITNKAECHEPDTGAETPSPADCSC